MLSPRHKPIVNPIFRYINEIWVECQDCEYYQKVIIANKHGKYCNEARLRSKCIICTGELILDLKWTPKNANL